MELTYQELLEKAHIGADFRNFANSVVGKELIRRAEYDELCALRKLVTIAPENRDEIFKAQLNAAVPRRALEWLAGAISEGDNAKWSIEQEGSL